MKGQREVLAHSKIMSNNHLQLEEGKNKKGNLNEHNLREPGGPGVVESTSCLFYYIKLPNFQYYFPSISFMYQSIELSFLCVRSFKDCM